RNRKMMAALTADVQRLLELVVAVMRLAFRARVRMSLRLLRLGCTLVLDGNVDAARHGTVEFRPPPPGSGYKPSAAVRRWITDTFAASGVAPVMPAPITVLLPARARRSLSAPSTASPSATG